MNDDHRRTRDAIARVVAVCDVLADLIPDEPETFASDVRTQWAVEMGLIRIGEGVNRIPAEILIAFSDQPWRQIVAMRNFAAHQYDDLEPRRVWHTVAQDVPMLRAYLVDKVLPGINHPGARFLSTGPAVRPARELDRRRNGDWWTAPDLRAADGFDVAWSRSGRAAKQA